MARLHFTCAAMTDDEFNDLTTRSLWDFDPHVAVVDV